MNRASEPVCALLLIVCLAFVANCFGADSEEASEVQVKAAMLYKFLGYTNWPEQAFSGEDSPYRVWVLGAEQVANELEQIAAMRRVNDRAIEVLKATSPREISEPHVVYVGQDAENYRQQMENLLETQPVLVITESPSGLASGSVINLRLINGRIGFEVSLAHAQKSDLEISSRLLAVAVSVEQ